MNKYENTYAAINRAVGKAIHRYSMIENGDKILVALSGGKDSLTLLYALNERRLRAPLKYELFPVFIDLGFEGDIAELLYEYCLQKGFELKVEKTDYGILAHSDKNRENPCFLCSWQRRKRLFEVAREIGCNKLAFGHNKDDIIETLLINIFYKGEISTMVPLQFFFKGRFGLIRPLAFVDEAMTKKFSAEQGFPDLVNPCPSSKRSKRSEIKELLAVLNKRNPKIKGNILRAMNNVKMDYLL